MTHFGIRHNKSGKWMTFQSGEVFWTTSRAVADVQLTLFTRFEVSAIDDYSVATFDEDQQEPGAVAK